jgi:hypothetical protein
MCIIKILSYFTKRLKTKRPEMASWQWFFHLDNAPVNAATIIQDWLIAHSIQVLHNPMLFTRSCSSRLLFVLAGEWACFSYD